MVTEEIQSDDSEGVEQLFEEVYDFNDGAGPVPAHRHENDPKRWGSFPGYTNIGGWVADTATVDFTAFVGRNCKVCGNAVVQRGCFIRDFVVVKDNAILQEKAGLYAGVEVSGNANIPPGYSLSGSKQIHQFYDFYIDQKKRHNKLRTPHPHVIDAKGQEWKLTDIWDDACVFYDG